MFKAVPLAVDEVRVSYNYGYLSQTSAATCLVTNAISRAEDAYPTSSDTSMKILVLILMSLSTVGRLFYVFLGLFPFKRVIQAETLSIPTMIYFLETEKIYFVASRHEQEENGIHCKGHELPFERPL